MHHHYHYNHLLLHHDKGCSVVFTGTCFRSAALNLTDDNYLEASTHLYKRVCPSVGRSVRRSVTSSLSSVNSTRNRGITHPQAWWESLPSYHTASSSTTSAAITTPPPQQPGRIVVSTGTCFFQVSQSILFFKSKESSPDAHAALMWQRTNWLLFAYFSLKS